jgi:hypothetical protein
MTLARRVFETVDKDLFPKLIDLLRALCRSGAANLSLVNAKQETLASILGAASVEQLDAQLTCIAELARIPLSPADMARAWIALLEQAKVAAAPLLPRGSRTLSTFE